ncbi:hypothetical protein [Actinopolyspora halophila]|uniref:hypothetical protein n=1 Tax=Actinopolyspora halophila TaxID=1850 RepID=UPI000368D898|nr:hypothetical protein [Actinopolyspora halophila]
MSEVPTSGAGSWRRLGDALHTVAAAWREAGAEQASSGSESTQAIHQLERAELEQLARAGYEAAEALSGIATVLSGQQRAARGWQYTQRAQREAWRNWRVAMDAELPGEETPS